MFEALKRISFSTLALLAIVFTTLRPAFADTHTDQVVDHFGAKSGHSKYQNLRFVPFAAFSEADAEDLDEEDSSLQDHLILILHNSHTSLAATQPESQIENSARFIYFDAVAKSNFPALFLRLCKILR